MGLGVLVAIFLICTGAYDAFIQAGARQTPETISISELPKNVPNNRHLIVTGGSAVPSKAVEYYRTRHGVRITGSEIYFIPIQDSSLASSVSASPPVLVKMTNEQFQKIKAAGGFESSRIEGIRMTTWDLESKAKEYLVNSFGNAAVEKMVILDYQHDIVGLWRGLGQSLAGFVLLGGLLFASATIARPRSVADKPAIVKPEVMSPAPSPPQRIEGKRRSVVVAIVLVCGILFIGFGLGVVFNVYHGEKAHLAQTERAARTTGISTVLAPERNLGGSATPPEENVDIAQYIYSKHASSVVTIRTYDDWLCPSLQGSGVIIGQKPADLQTSGKFEYFILTNYHVLNRASLVEVELKWGEKETARVCYLDEPSDTAILRIESSVQSEVPKAAEIVDVGRQVVAIGTPEDLGWTISNGIVSAIRMIKGTEFVQFTAPVSHGSSGGAVFNAKGELIGITTFKNSDGENLNFALRFDLNVQSRLQQQFNQGECPYYIDDQFWCIGHFEQDISWMDHNERASSWKAHSTVIEEAKRNERGVFKNQALSDKLTAVRERSGSADKRPHHPLNVAQDKTSAAYASRFESFPDDYWGWCGAVSLETDEKEAYKLLAIGMQRWPHRAADPVMSDLSFSNKPEEAMRFLATVAKSIPTKSDISHFIAMRKTGECVGERFMTTVEQIADNIRIHADFIAEQNIQVRTRAADVEEMLRSKGWER